jgi:diketogulonate reductase-like aldo/keto reductase
MRKIEIRGGLKMPVLGQGTWHMGESASELKHEVAALELGLDLGMTLIDSAEMYAAGGAEKVVAQAIVGCRERVFLVSKVLPSNASKRGTVAACERSLRRLGTDYLDLYLLHWRGAYPLGETFEAFQVLQHQGKIRAFGVSNFDIEDLEAARSVDCGAMAVNQLLYHLNQRGPEFALLQHQHGLGIASMAYSPLDEGRLLTQPALKRIARAAGVTPAQLALAWLLARTDVCAIPKTSSLQRVKENCAACELDLAPDVLKALDAAFPPPTCALPLAMI